MKAKKPAPPQYRFISKEEREARRRKESFIRRIADAQDALIVAETHWQSKVAQDSLSVPTTSSFYRTAVVGLCIYLERKESIMLRYVPDIFLDGIYEVPHTREDEKRDCSVLVSSLTAVTVYQYPKIGTHVILTCSPWAQLGVGVSRWVQKGLDAWIIGYASPQSKRYPGDYEVIVAFRKMISQEEPSLGYCSARLLAEWLQLGGTQSLLSDVIVKGNVKHAQCKCCGKNFRVDRLTLGFCKKNKCNLQCTREQQAH